MDIESMSQQKREAFLKDALDLSENHTLKKIINTIIREQSDFSIKRASTWQQVIFGRATINGADLVRERIELLASEYKKMVEPNIIQDKHSIV